MKGSSRATALLLTGALVVFGGCTSRHWQPVAWPDEMAPAGEDSVLLAEGATVRIETTTGARHEGVLREVSAHTIIVTESTGLVQDVSLSRADVAAVAVAERQPWHTERIVAGVTLGALAVVALVVASVAIWGTPGIGN